jgi:hypothetical protein
MDYRPLSVPPRPLHEPAHIATVACSAAVANAAPALLANVYIIGLIKPVQFLRFFTAVAAAAAATTSAATFAASNRRSELRLRQWILLRRLS